MPSARKPRKRDKAKQLEYGRRHYDKNKDVVRLAKYERSLARRYGITLLDKQRMYDNQGGCCAICKKKADCEELVVDHDHATGRVRGVLCDLCNRGLGYFTDSPAKLASAAFYLSEVSPCR